MKHYFLYCPSFAALSEKLFTSAAQLLGNRWHCASDKKNIDWLLNGISTADFQLKLSCFSLSSRLFCYQIASVSRCVCFLYTFFCFFLCSFTFLCVFDLDVYLYF